MSPTLRAFRLGEPTPVSLRGLTLSCHAKVPGSSFHLIPSAPRAAETALVPSRQTTPNHTRVRRVPRRRQSAFDRPDPCLAAGRSQRRTNRTSVHDRAPSSHRTAKPAWLGHWACRHAAITPSTRAAFAPRACEKRRLSPNLCSRLVFKCTQGDIAFSGGGSHLLSSIRTAEFQPVGSRPSPCKRESTAVPPLPVGTAPNGSAVGAATANRRRNIHLDGRPVSRACSRAACSTAAGSDASTPDASVSLSCRYRHPGAPTAAKARPDPRHTKNGDATDRSALPPTGPSSSRLGSRPTETHMSRHRAAGFATSATASDGRSRFHPGTARPRIEPVFTGNRRPPVACQLLQRDVTRARPRPVRTPTLAQQAAPNRMAPP